MATPVDVGDQFQSSAGFTSYRQQETSRVVVLIGIGGGVEGVGTIRLIVQPGLNIDMCSIDIEAALPEKVQYVVITVADISVRPLVSCREGVHRCTCFVCTTQIRPEEPMHATLQLRESIGSHIFLSDDVDSPRKGACTIHQRRGTLYDLNPFDIGEIDGNVETVMSCVGAGEVHTIEKDGCLIE